MNENNKPTNIPKTTGSILGYIFGKLAIKRQDDGDCVVQLTQELARHIVDMYYKTDWDELTDEHGMYTVDIPESIFTGEIDEEDWYSHVGEYIYVSWWGDPWDIMGAEVFVEGCAIHFVDSILDNALCDLDLLLNDECRDGFIREMNRAVAIR